jgi:ribonuclease P protein subunit POP4
LKSLKARLLATRELIGLQATVVRGTDPTLRGVGGEIVDETMNTLTLRTGSGEKRINKKAVTLAIQFPDERIEISGTELLQRPDERLKKLWRKAR